ncbi:hypothetical protein ACFLYA_02785, partial [Candidatus Dependentiae bacterium]
MISTNKHISVLAKVIVSLFIGIVVSFVLLQNDYRLKKLIEANLISAFQSSYHYKVDCNVESCNLFSPTIKIKHLYAISCDDTWYWKCSPVEIRFSWIDLLLSGVMELHITIGSSQLYTRSDKDGMAFAPPIIEFFQDVSWNIPTILKSFHIKRGALTVEDTSLQYVSKIDFASITKNMSGTYKTKISFLDGSLSVCSKGLLDRLSGAIGFDIAEKSGNMHVTVESKCTVDVPFLKGNKTCFVTGKWFYDQGLFNLISQDKSFSIAPIKLYYLGDTLFTECNVETALDDIAGFIFDGSDDDLSGKSSVQLRGEFGPLGYGFAGSLVLRDVSYKGVELFSFGKVTGKKIRDTYKGFLSFLRKDGLLLSGSLDFDTQKNNFSCNLENETDIKSPFLPYWKIGSKKAKLSVSSQNLQNLSGTIACCATSEQLGSNIDFLGDIAVAENMFTIEGSFDDKAYKLGLLLSPKIRLKHLSYKNRSDAESLCAINALKHDDNKCAGNIKFSFIQSLLKDYFDYEIQGE